MLAMDLLAQDFNTITFQDVVDFCDQQIVEGTELDYKKEIPRDLRKHFAAMSNRYGGLIIIGVEEDSRTGLPSRYEGLINDGKLIDRIHQFANDVRPLPSYSVRTTDEVNGKVFLLVRISEGGAPPYTPKNDPTVYLRTGNITTPLGPADVDIVRDLHAKRATAETERRDNVTRAKARFHMLLQQADAQRSPENDEAEGAEAVDRPASGKVQLLASYLQPFYPHRELAPPRVIFNKLNELRVTNSEERHFPSRQMRPVARGMLSFERAARNPSFLCDQIYANGLFLHVENTDRTWLHKGESNDIFLADIGRILYTTLLFGRKLYNEVGYSGLTRGALELEGPRGRAIRIILASTQRESGFRDDLPVTIDETCTWQIEADTHQLSSDDWVQNYFYERMREIYWDLGVLDAAKSALDDFVKHWAFR